MCLSCRPEAHSEGLKLTSSPSRGVFFILKRITTQPALRNPTCWYLTQAIYSIKYYLETPPKPPSILKSTQPKLCWLFSSNRVDVIQPNVCFLSKAKYKGCSIKPHPFCGKLTLKALPLTFKHLSLPSISCK